MTLEKKSLKRRKMNEAMQNEAVQKQNHKEPKGFEKEKERKLVSCYFKRPKPVISPEFIQNLDAQELLTFASLNQRSARKSDTVERFYYLYEHDRKVDCQLFHSTSTSSFDNVFTDLISTFSYIAIPFIDRIFFWAKNKVWTFLPNLKSKDEGQHQLEKEKHQKVNLKETKDTKLTYYMHEPLTRCLPCSCIGYQKKRDCMPPETCIQWGCRQCGFFVVFPFSIQMQPKEDHLRKEQQCGYVVAFYGQSACSPRVISQSVRCSVRNSKLQRLFLNRKASLEDVMMRTRFQNLLLGQGDLDFRTTIDISS